MFDEGRVVWISPFGPTNLRLEGRSPISEALSQLGVPTTKGRDEFDTAGLGLHRRTEDWLENSRS